jgi:tyrosine-protein kinase Etk/Wzc
MEDFFGDDQGRLEGSSFNFKQYFSKLLARYRWILLAIICSLIAAFLYLRYSVAQYQISGYIIVGGAALETGANNVLVNAGIESGAENTASAVNNEIFILQSHNINGEVVDSLDLDVLITSQGHLKNQPIFKDSLPVSINVKRRDVNSVSNVFTLALQNKTFSLEDKNNKYVGSYGKPIIIHSDTIVISRKDNAHFREAEYSLQLASRLSTIRKYISRLTVEQAKNGGIGLLKLSVTDELPVRADHYLQVLIHSYNVSFLNFKNQAIKRALAFLNQRLEVVSDELHDQEDDVRDFKATNKLYDVSTAANEMLANLQSLDAQKSQNNYQDELLNLVEAGVKKYSGKEEIVVSTNGLLDPVLNAQVAKYNELVFNKQTIQSTGTKDDPRLAPINDQLAEFRSNILKNIQNIKKQFGASRSSVASQESKYSSRFQSLPEKEQQFVELTRKMSIKEAQYTFLLQKKEETEIQLVSSDAGVSRTVDDVLNNGIVSPVGPMIYGVAFAFGLLLPSIIILVLVLMNDKIETRQEIEEGTTVPILGELSFSASESPIVITSNNRTAIAEQLRAIRTNINFLGADESQKVFIVTSTMGGEGKSFLSLNLGNSFAISNKRVAVLELDLRKPMLSKNLGLTNHLGISNFLVNKDLKPEDIISPLEEYPNLFLLNSGPVPPNPGELIINPRMSELIAYLREHFDYVILDSPPVGLVADALSLASLSDISLYVSRPNYSLRSSLKLVNSLQKNHKLPKLSLVINGIQSQNTYGFGYGYGYGGKGYGYYSDELIDSENISNKFNKIFKRSK